MQKNYNENLCAGAAIRDDKGRRISKLFEAPHPKMTVGYAKNLIMPNDPTEQEFNLRQAGGDVIEDGVAVIDKVKGNSMVWNQLMKFGESTKTDNGITYEIKKDGRIHIFGTATERSTATYYNSVGAVISGHKYIVVSTNNIICGEANGAMPSTDTPSGIQTCTKSSTTPVWFLRVYNGITIDVTFQPQLVDITQMFGAGNEPSTYEEFLSRKPKVADEYAYNEGSIVNNKVEKVVTTERNLWDEEWELGYYDDSGRKIESSNSIRSKNMCACLPHTSYYWRIPNKANGSYMGNCYFYDISGAFISKSPVGPSAYLTATTPSNARFVAFALRTEYGTTYNHDICINISDPTINGKYFPYEEHELDLSWIKEIKDVEGVKLFEDGMKSAGTSFDEVGKNKAVKRIGVVDAGTLIWAYKGGRFAATIPGAYSTDLRNGMLLGYATSQGQTWDDVEEGMAGFAASYVRVKDSSYTDVEEFKVSLAGVPLYYELAEPIEVEYDEKNLTYPVVAGGTEEAITSEPSSAFRANIGYGIDAVKTILDLKARVEALEKK